MSPNPMKGLFQNKNKEKEPIAQELGDIVDPNMRAALDGEKRLIVQAIQHHFKDQDLLELPKTLRQAYTELLLKEKPSIHDIAKYYAHLKVASQAEHVHSSRKANTQAFYKNSPQRTGSDIFTNDNDKKYAQQFDEEFKSAVSDISQARAPEQKKFLEFQSQVNTEVSNIKKIMQSSEELGKNVESNEAKTLIFLNHTLEKMLKGSTRHEVEFYAKDALSLLTHLESRCDDDIHMDAKVTIKALKDQVVDFKDHHLKLMESLTEKRHKLQLSTLLKVLAVAASGPLAHAGGVAVLERAHVPHHLIANRDLLSEGVHGGNMAVGSALDRGGTYLEALPEDPKEKPKENSELLHNLMSVAPKSSLSDMVADTQKDIEEHPKKAAVIYGTMFVCAAVSLLCPVAAAAIGGTVALGRAGKDFFDNKKNLDYAEQTSESRRIEHEMERKDYLRAHPGKETVFENHQEKAQALENLQDKKKFSREDQEQIDTGEIPLVDIRDFRR